MKPITGLALFYLAFLTGMVATLAIAMNEPYALPAAGGMLTVWVYIVSTSRTPRNAVTLLVIALGLFVGFTVWGSSVGAILAAGMLAAVLLLIITTETCYEDDHEETYPLPGRQAQAAPVPTPSQTQLQKPVRRRNPDSR